MKKILNRLPYMAAFLLMFSVSSCEPVIDDDVTDFGTGPNLVGFAGSSLTLNAEADGEEHLRVVPITILGPSVAEVDSDVTVNIAVDPNSTAVEGEHFLLPSSTVVLSPQESEGDIYSNDLPITILTEGVEPPLEEAPVLILNITEINTSDNVLLNDKRETTEVSINYLCPSNLAGTYSVTTTYLQHDYLPDFSTHTMEVEVTQESTGTYSVTDFSGGLYSVGPYNSAYGTSGISGTFVDSCGEISWDGVSDPWGSVSPMSGGVNSVDPETGVITISWHNDAYGEEGVSVYTPVE